MEEDAQEVGVPHQDSGEVDRMEDLALGREVHIEVVAIELQAQLHHVLLRWHLHHLDFNSLVSLLLVGKEDHQCSKLGVWAQR